MGMWQHERTTTHECPKCGATRTVTRTVNTTSAPSGETVGACNVCGWEREHTPPYDRQRIRTSYVTIPQDAEPREGVQKLVENTGISMAEAADVLDEDSDTRLEDIE